MDQNSEEDFDEFISSMHDFETDDLINSQKHEIVANNKSKISPKAKKRSKDPTMKIKPFKIAKIHRCSKHSGRPITNPNKDSNLHHSSSSQKEFDVNNSVLHNVYGSASLTMSGKKCTKIPRTSSFETGHQDSLPDCQNLSKSTTKGREKDVSQSQRKFKDTYFDNEITTEDTESLDSIEITPDDTESPDSTQITPEDTESPDSNQITTEDTELLDSTQITPEDTESLDSVQITPEDTESLDSVQITPEDTESLDSVQITPEDTESLDSVQITPEDTESLDSVQIIPEDTESLDSIGSKKHTKISRPSSSLSDRYVNYRGQEVISPTLLESQFELHQGNTGPKKVKKAHRRSKSSCERKTNYSEDQVLTPYKKTKVSQGESSPSSSQFTLTGAKREKMSSSSSLEFDSFIDDLSNELDIGDQPLKFGKLKAILNTEKRRNVKVEAERAIDGFNENITVGGTINVQLQELSGSNQANSSTSGISTDGNINGTSVEKTNEDLPDLIIDGQPDIILLKIVRKQAPVEVNLDSSLLTCTTTSASSETTTSTCSASSKTTTSTCSASSKTTTSTCSASSKTTTSTSTSTNASSEKPQKPATTSSTDKSPKINPPVPKPHTLNSSVSRQNFQPSTNTSSFGERSSNNVSGMNRSWNQLNSYASQNYSRPISTYEATPSWGNGQYCSNNNQAQSSWGNGQYYSNGQLLPSWGNGQYYSNGQLLPSWGNGQYSSNGQLLPSWYNGQNYANMACNNNLDSERRTGQNGSFETFRRYERNQNGRSPYYWSFNGRQHRTNYRGNDNRGEVNNVKKPQAVETKPKAEENKPKAEENKPKAEEEKPKVEKVTNILFLDEVKNSTYVRIEPLPAHLIKQEPEFFASPPRIKEEVTNSSSDANSEPVQTMNTNFKFSTTVTPSCPGSMCAVGSIEVPLLTSSIVSNCSRNQTSAVSDNIKREKPEPFETETSATFKQTTLEPKKTSAKSSSTKIETPASEYSSSQAGSITTSTSQAPVSFSTLPIKPEKLDSI